MSNRLDDSAKLAGRLSSAKHYKKRIAAKLAKLEAAAKRAAKKLEAAPPYERGYQKVTDSVHVSKVHRDILEHTVIMQYKYTLLLMHFEASSYNDYYSGVAQAVVDWLEQNPDAKRTFNRLDNYKKSTRPLRNAPVSPARDRDSKGCNGECDG